MQTYKQHWRYLTKLSVRAILVRFDRPVWLDRLWGVIVRLVFTNERHIAVWSTLGGLSWRTGHHLLERWWPERGDWSTFNRFGFFVWWNNTGNYCSFIWFDLLRIYKNKIRIYFAFPGQEYIQYKINVIQSYWVVEKRKNSSCCILSNWRWCKKWAWR